MINRDDLDEIQGPFGQVLSRIRFSPQPNQQDKFKTPDKDINDAQLLARLVDLPADKTAPTPTFTWCFMAFPPCPQARIWEVTRITVLAADPSNVLAGVTAVAFKGTTVPQDQATYPTGAFPDGLAFAGQVPNTQFPGRYGVFCLPGQRIVIALKGLTAGTSVTGSIGLIDRDMYQFLKSLVS